MTPTAPTLGRQGEQGRRRRVGEVPALKGRARANLMASNPSTGAPDAGHSAPAMQGEGLARGKLCLFQFSINIY